MSCTALQVIETQIVKFSDTGKTRGCFIFFETREDLIGALDFDGEVSSSARVRLFSAAPAFVLCASPTYGSFLPWCRCLGGGLSMLTLHKAQDIPQGVGQVSPGAWKGCSLLLDGVPYMASTIYTGGSRNCRKERFWGP